MRLDSIARGGDVVIPNQGRAASVSSRGTSFGLLAAFDRDPVSTSLAGDEALHQLHADPLNTTSADGADPERVAAVEVEAI
jgi:hypothetical protein